MEKEKFLELLAHPERMESSDLGELLQLTKDYPFFQNAHLLYLYGLHQLASDQFNEQLKRSAIYLQSRSVLREAILHGWSPKTTAMRVFVEKLEAPIQSSLPDPVIVAPMDQQHIAESETLKETIATEDIVEPEISELVIGEEIIPEPTKAESPAEIVELPVDLPEAGRVNNAEEGKLEIIDSVTPEVEAEEPAEQTEVVMQAEDTKGEDAISFSLEETQPIEVQEKREYESVYHLETSSDLLDFEGIESESFRDNKNNLIDQFLKVNPRITARLDLEDTRGDISEPGLKEDEDIVTETLAMILEQQGLFEKAIRAYEKLILKYPEKSTYFASRIEELSKRIK